jgi:hypothetical protein
MLAVFLDSDTQNVFRKAAQTISRKLNPEEFENRIWMKLKSSTLVLLPWGTSQS